ncbi:MAG: sugar ABC transporter ATP-binding protein, partial [Oscillospiraceae bacterium]|nr:sugar ABC transporter ATP-binding protein [Oscillospiraceae bacterium]
MQNTILRLKDITKRYPGVTAVDHINFSLLEGEIHALIGENGAGKSTLIKMISGAISPSEGQIIYKDQTYKMLTPALSRHLKIGVVYQEFNLVRELTVWENVFLGKEIKYGRTGLINRQEMRKRAKEIFEQLEIHMDVDALVSSLSVGFQQLLEVAKVLAEDVKILILDEPTAPLTEEEVSTLLRIVKNLSARGVSIIFISHRLEEIFQIADRITILRDGKTIDTVDADCITKDELISKMVGRELTNVYPVRENISIGEEVLRLEHLTGNGLQDISLSVHRGEILGLCGLVGAGRTELAQMLFGIAPVDSGTILYKGKDFTPKNPRDAIAHGIALVPEDRKNDGLLLEMDLNGNITLPILRRISKATLIDSSQEKIISAQYEKAMRIKTPSMKQLAKNLSGGNQQKVVLAKWLATNPDLIILDEPTRGIDVGAKYEIYCLVNQMGAEGK